MSIEGQGHSLPYIFQVLYVLCFTRPRYEVSVYRTIGPLVILNRFIYNFIRNVCAASQENPSLGFPTRSDTNRARDLKFWI